MSLRFDLLGDAYEPKRRIKMTTDSAAPKCPSCNLLMWIASDELQHYVCENHKCDFNGCVLTGIACKALSAKLGTAEPAAYLKPTSVGAKLFVHGVQVPTFAIGCGHDEHKQDIVNKINSAATAKLGRQYEAIDVIPVEDCVDGKDSRYGRGLFSTDNCVVTLYRLIEASQNDQ